MSDVGAVFLDLDGCLIDSTIAITRSIDHALAAIGVAPRGTAALRSSIGPPLMTSFARILAEEGRDPALAARCVDLYRERYVATAVEETEVVAGVPEALEALGRLAPLAIVTTKPRPAAVMLLEALGLIDAMVAVFGPDADHRVEEKEVTLARALATLDVAAAVTVMVGDREHDVIAGHACGTATIGVLWGAGDRDELEAARADALVERPDALVGATLEVTRRRQASR
jgi:phosphoglycolate phosphatase